MRGCHTSMCAISTVLMLHEVRLVDWRTKELECAAAYIRKAACLSDEILSTASLWLGLHLCNCHPSPARSECNQKMTRSSANATDVFFYYYCLWEVIDQKYYLLNCYFWCIMEKKLQVFKFTKKENFFLFYTKRKKAITAKKISYRRYRTLVLEKLISSCSFLTAPLVLLFIPVLSYFIHMLICVPVISECAAIFLVLNTPNSFENLSVALSFIC